MIYLCIYLFILTIPSKSYPLHCYLTCVQGVDPMAPLQLCPARVWAYMSPCLSYLLFYTRNS